MDSLFADLSALSAMTGEKAEKNMQEALNYLGLDLMNIARTMRPYHPLEILKMAAWEERRVARLKGGDRVQGLYAHLLPVLMQSVLLSTYYDTSYPIASNRDIRKKDWNRLLSLSEDAVRRLLKYIESYTVYVVRSGLVSEENAESYRSTILRQFFPPEESVETIEREGLLWYGYALDDEKVVTERFGTDVRSLIDGMYKVAVNAVEGIDKLTDDFSLYKAEMLLTMAQKRTDDRYKEMSDDDLRDMIVKENGWESRVKDLQGRRDDFDLFRPEFVCDLPSQSYKTLSREIGSLDINAYIKKGIWPATVFPFLEYRGMFFSFVSSHIFTYGQRILAENASLYLRDTAAAAAACRLLFNETDNVDVYSFDGNKVDVSILSSITEVNAVENPGFYEARLRQHDEDRHVRPQPGHRLLLLDPDTYGPLERLDDGTFSSSVYYLIRSANSTEGREEFHRTIFGSLDLPEKTEILSYLDEDEVDDRDAVVDTVDDDISDEYEYDSEDDDEKARALEEKERKLDEELLPSEDHVPIVPDIEKLKEKYELTSDIIRRDEENDAEADVYEKELDDDDYSYEDGDVLPPEADDDEEIEDEALYDEAEGDDLYQQESPYDSDQGDLFDGLFDDPDEEIDSELETEEEATEEEAEYEKAEEEATDFATEYSKELEERTQPEAAQPDDYSPIPVYESEESADSVEEASCQYVEDDDKTAPDTSVAAEDNAEGHDDASTDVSLEAHEAACESHEEPMPAEECMPSEDIPVTVPEAEGSHMGDAEPSEADAFEDREDVDVIPQEETEDPEISQALPDAEPAILDETMASDTDDIPTGPETTEESITASPDITEEDGADTAEPVSTVIEEEPATEAGSVSEEAAADVAEEEAVASIQEEEPAEDEVPEDDVSEESQPESVSDMVDRGVLRRVSDEESVFEMVGNGNSMVEDDFSDLDGVVREIAEKVGRSSEFVSFVRASDSDMTHYLEDVIRRSWEKQRQDGKDKMFSIYDYSLSILIATQKVMDEIRVEELLNNAGAVMYSRQKGSWNALILSFDDEYRLLSAEERKITPSSFTPSNWKICRIVGEQLMARSR